MVGLFLFGLVFGFINAVQSRLVNNGTKTRFPDAVVFVWVFVAASVYATATRSIAGSTGILSACSYALGNAIGVVGGCWLANGPLYDRWHEAARAQATLRIRRK